MNKKAEQAFIVIGGGIGGLAIALGIAETKQRVKVLEHAQEFGESKGRNSAGSECHECTTAFRCDG